MTRAESRRRRLCAGTALLLMTAALGMAVAVAIGRFPRGLVTLVCLVGALWVSWWGLLHRGPMRALGLAAGALLIAGSLTAVILEHRVLEDVLIIAAVLAALEAARRTFRVHKALPAASRPARPVLFYNPLSGGGKATRFHLADEARRRGIEPIELSRGDDLETLVRGAVARGADALAMAGGDGSQAIVAKVAAEHDMPYACIPAGTRNHFALDLGVDRDDVVGALEAFVGGGERQVDLAEINGRIFVNNVSLGLYAEAVQQPGYREAKLHTLLDTIPSVLGADAAPPKLLWPGQQGQESAAALLISNNAYRLGPKLGSGTRPRLDGAELGITVLVPREASSNHQVYRLAMQQRTAETFEVQADEPVAAGIDGEAAYLQPPLRFRVLPRALRVRIAPNHPGASPSAFEPERPWQLVQALAAITLHGAPERY